MQHINNHYLRVDDIELRQILEETTNEELKGRIRELLGLADDPIDYFHSTIAYYNDKWLHTSRDMGWEVSMYKVSLHS